MPIDYSNTHFYKLVCKDTALTDCFVGESTNLTDTTDKHRQCSKTHNRKVYKFIREDVGFDNSEVVLLATKPCVDKCEALRKQRTYFEQANATLNVRVPSRTPTEYIQTNRAYILARKKEYHESSQASINTKERSTTLQTGRLY